jgi:hypothetical protein
MTTERPDAGRLLDRRDLLKGAGALGALAALGALQTPALAQNGDNGHRDVDGLIEDLGRIADQLAEELVRQVDELTPGNLRDTFDFLELITVGLLRAAIEALRTNPALEAVERRRRELEEEQELLLKRLEEFQEDVIRAILRRPRPGGVG